VEDTTTASATKDERASGSVTSQQDTSASTQPAITALVKSQEGTSTPGETKKSFPTFITTQLPSTADQNADVLHQSVVVIAGNSFSLPCSSPFKTKFFWGYCPTGSNQLNIIYNGGQMDKDFQRTAKANVSNCSDRTCTFNVNDFQLGDAGFFSCIHRNDSRYWSISVLGKCLKIVAIVA